MAYTTEQLLERWEDVHEIENMMGRRAFFDLLVRDQQVFEEMWSHQDPCLGLNNGYYKGYDAVAGYFKGLHDLYLRRAELAKTAYPDELGGKAAEDLIGVGGLHFDNLTTPVIELAEDRQTAKGLWYMLGGQVDFGVSGRETEMCWGRIGVDFIKEDGAWKIWHMVIALDIDTPMGTSWAEPAPEKAADPVFGALADVKLPEPNVPRTVHELWHSRRQLKAFPPVPKAYKTFAETFSYGV